MPDRPVLEAVLFDAGGTLVRLDFEWMSEWLSAHGFAVTAEQLRRSEIEGRRRYDASAGGGPSHAPQPLGRRGDVRAYLGGMLADAGAPEAVQRAATSAFVERQAGPGIWSRPMEGARAAIDGVLALGLRAAVVSNSDGRAAQHLRDAGVLDGLEFVIDSHLVGIEKPDPAILCLALERLGVRPERAIYVGDIRSVDETVARAAGTQFVLVDPWGEYAAGISFIASLPELIPFLAARFSLPQTAAAHPRDARRD
ncbi:MAG: HAD family hydrolase [Candidatus Eiseniibacteriota bacterium]